MSFPFCRAALFLMLCLTFANGVRAEENVSQSTIRAAAGKSLKLLSDSAAGSADERTCFTCHSQALPVLAMAEAKLHGFEIDAKNFTRQLDHTAAHLSRGREKYAAGKGLGGRVDTAGYALWTLESGGRPADEVTADVVHYILVYRKEAKHWPRSGNRPPSEASAFTTTYLALRALATFATEEQAEQVKTRQQEALAWLQQTKPVDTEDRVYRLRALHLLEADEGLIKTAAEELLDQQQPDGGWAQTADLKSDAYATGTVLAALHYAGQLAADENAYQQGLKYLLKTQDEDGAWHVVSRSKPFQTYYETGFPYSEDQFISTAATGWAAIALLKALK